jgi:hypothetical protein
VATKFDDCLRRCDPCGIAVSNGADSRYVTYIHRDSLNNIPIESRKGAGEALRNAFNVRNRKSKEIRFGFSTSEDAVTWVVFTYLLRSGQLSAALARTQIVDETSTLEPTLLLWGVPAENSPRGAEIRNQLGKLCSHLGEDSNSFSEPDVIIDFGEAGIIFIEVKYRSTNDRKLAGYPGWSKYESAARWGQFGGVKASGCYELARNWCLLKGLAGDRPARLINLGPDKLFRGREGARLDHFVGALDLDARSHFMKVRWSDLLGPDLGEAPDWFVQYCKSRHLTAWVGQLKVLNAGLEHE